MSVTIKDNTVTLTAQTARSASLGLRYIAEAVVAESTPHTPKDKGNLSRDVVKQVLGLRGVIEWRKVYAQFQERGMRRDGSHRVKSYTTSGTGPHFAFNAVKKIALQSDKYFRLAGLIK